MKRIIKTIPCDNGALYATSAGQRRQLAQFRGRIEITEHTTLIPLLGTVQRGLHRKSTKKDTQTDKQNKGGYSMGFISHICEKNNIKLASLAAVGLEGEDGTKGGGFVTSTEKYENLILFDDTVSETEKNHIVLHELGHILLGHLDNDLDANAKEMEANIFAAVILAHTLYEEYISERKKAPAILADARGAKAINF